MIRRVFTTYLPKHDPRIHESTSRYEPHAHAELLRPELCHTGLSTKGQNCHFDELLTHARTLLPTSLCDSLSPHYLCHLYANRPSDRYTCMEFWCRWAALIYICILQLIFTALCVRLLLCVSVTFVVMLHCVVTKGSRNGFHNSRICFNRTLEINMQNKAIAKRKCNRTRQVELQWHTQSDCQRSFITLEYKSAGKMQINVLSHVQPRHSMHADIILAQAEANLHNLPYSISDNATLSKSTHRLNNYAVRQNIGPDFFPSDSALSCSSFLAYFF